MTLSDTGVIPGLHQNLFRVTRALQNILQVMSEGESLIFKKTQSKIVLIRKWQTPAGKIFLLTANIYKNPNDTARLSI